VKNQSTHRVSAWVHPAVGDDYQVDIYFKGAPSERHIQKQLRSMKSEQIDDYTIVDLSVAAAVTAELVAK
jgi:hypothetical protein